MPMTHDATHARAIQIGDRFFTGFGKVRQVKTAWCLAGARLYQAGVNEEVNADIARLDAAGKAFSVVTVTVTSAF